MLHINVVGEIMCAAWPVWSALIWPYVIIAYLHVCWCWTCNIYYVHMRFNYFRDSLILETGFLTILVAPFNLVFWKRYYFVVHVFHVIHGMWDWYKTSNWFTQIRRYLCWDKQKDKNRLINECLCVWTFRPSAKCHDGMVLWLVRWLLFRLMFASGVVKLTSQCPTWWGLTALNYHFESQVQ